MCIYVTGQIWFQVNFDLTLVDFQFPLFPMNNKNTLNIGVKSCLLGDKMRNEEAINSR